MARRTRREWLQIGSGQSYFNRSQFPLQCLVFISPLLLLYQLGAILHPWSLDQSTPQHVIAFVLMLRFFSYFGAVGNYMPLACVVAMLLAWHLARKDKWDFEPKLYGLMAMESITWAIPVFVIGLALQNHVAGMYAHEAPPPPLAAASLATAQITTPAPVASPDAPSISEAPPPPPLPRLRLPWQSEAVISIGAGVYEELLFRLVAITLLNIILVDICKIKLQNAIPIIILISAVSFAWYHVLGDTPLTVAYFLFLTAFGVYTAGIFIFRGFGIVVGCHAIYDLIVVATSHSRGY